MPHALQGLIPRLVPTSLQGTTERYEDNKEVMHVENEVQEEDLVAGTHKVTADDLLVVIPCSTHRHR